MSSCGRLWEVWELSPKHGQLGNQPLPLNPPPVSVGLTVSVTIAAEALLLFLNLVSDWL